MGVDMIDLRQGDCLELLKDVPDGSVDAIIADIPYGTTQAKWDSVIPLDEMWQQLKRIIKKDAPIVLFSSQPFTTVLIASNMPMFKYEWIWHKNRGSGHLNAKIMPMKYHENVIVFGKGKITFNPIGEEYADSSKKRYKEGELWNKAGRDFENGELYGEFKTEPYVFIRPEGKSPSTVQFFKIVPTQKGRLHPTQKPINLMEYLIKTYSNEGDTVLDFTAGSMSTAIACINTNRKGIMIEKDPHYFKVGSERVERALSEKGD